VTTTLASYDRSNLPTQIATIDKAEDLTVYEKKLITQQMQREAKEATGGALGLRGSPSALARPGMEDSSKPQSFITESLQWAFIAAHFNGPLTGKTISTK